MGIFDNIYGIMSMSGNYEQRKVNNTKEGDWEVDTAMVTDRGWIYETAVRHTDFRDGLWIVVEGVNTKEEAFVMHDKWVEFMRGNPSEIYDAYEAEYYTRQ